ncbi:MAG: hypothetical protein HY332_07260 [Chloroflexi bacterium]|nr:hypothetical protein [Chloroflexota bacterium]
MRVWAAFIRQQPGAPWRLRALASLSAERARALVEREQVRSGLVCCDLIVREFDSVKAVPWTLEA